MTATLSSASLPARAGIRGGLVRRSLAGPVARLRTQAGVALLLTAALLVAALLGLADTAARTRQLTDISEPRAVAAGQLYRALSDLDAQRAKSLVVGYSAVPPAPGATPELVDDGVLAALTAQTDQTDASQQLAALAVSAGADKVQPLLDQLSLYDAWTGTEEYAVGTQADPVVGQPSPVALDTYAQADALLQSSLLPQVRSVMATADAQVDSDRDAAHTAALVSVWLLVALGVLALLALLWWQRDLARCYRRVLNVPLLVATACVMALVLGSASALLGAASEVDAAVNQGYTPYARLAQASVVAVDAEARESRWVVDPGYRDALAAQFQADAGQVRTLLAADGSGDGGGGDSTASTDGSAAASVVQQRFSAYLATDAGLRAVADGGDVNQAAIQLTGVGRSDVGFAYYDFSVHLDDLAATHAAAFTSHAVAADSDLNGWAATSAVLLGLALLLVLTGVRPRLREYA
ncbi:Tfp pilus assembly protein PilV [Streptacidiphilus sp. BW17]|uniref:hypothetical protein n=1 Tax=Streptacidiphilus sp. BW17 TaxID=3156274 RepID=UPI003515C4E1